MSIKGAQILSIKNIAAAADFFEQADAETLLCFDMDNTLVMPKNPAFRRGIYQETPALDAYKKKLPAEKLAIFLPYLLLAYPSVPTEKSFPERVQRLTARQVPVLSLTGSNTQDLLARGFVPQIRYTILQGLGYPVTHFFAAHQTDLVFRQLPQRRGTFPAYYKGILASNGRANKPQALEALLQTTKLQPKRIIFMDDEVSNVTALAEYFTTHYPEIELIGLHYTFVPDAIAQAGNSSAQDEKILSAWKEAYASFDRAYAAWEKKNTMAP
jgi:hypothetical protein